MLGSRIQWLCDESGIARFVHLPLRGQRRLGLTVAHLDKLSANEPTLLLPVELRRVNHTASTNAGDFTFKTLRKPYNASSMSNPPQIEQITERVERLLVRYEELQRTNALLTEQVQALSAERDSLKSRLGAARARVDALLERLSETMGADSHKDAT